jgi:hypothetical protein
MRPKDVFTFISTRDSEADATRLLDSKDVVALLRQTRDGDVPIYVSAGDYFVYGTVVPNALLHGNYIDELLDWNFSVPGGYGYGCHWPKGAMQPLLFEPLDSVNPAFLGQAVATVFVRRFEGRGGSYVEPNQRMTHVLGLHHVADKDGWCALDATGDIIPKLKVLKTEAGTICTLDRESLDFFLVTSDSSLVRVVDVTYHGPAALSSNRLSELVKRKRDEIYLRIRRVRSSGAAVVVRGFDILRVRTKDRASVLAKIEGKELRKYARFKIMDFKNDRVVEWTCDPKRLGNYFVSSKLPFETSSAFFKPEVLTQYRTDPSRYTVGPREVSCAGLWSIRYDINDEGQVHAYVIDLAWIPYEEQLRWQAFNEPPRSTISTRAYREDFLGEWTTDYDPLVSLRQIVEDFPQHDRDGNVVGLWRLGNLPPTRNLDFLGYVVTHSKKEFEDQILVLAQVLVEGFQKSVIDRIAFQLGCRDQQLASLKQLDRVLAALQVSDAQRKEVMSPLFDVQAYRSVSVAHRGKKDVPGDQRKYFRDLLAQCDVAMRSLATMVETGLFSR